MSAPAKRKVFVPLENNPEVMNDLAHALGLSKRYAFHDVLSLDDPSLLALVPRPCHAILFTFPTTTVSETFYKDDERDRPTYDGSGPIGPGEPVHFFFQTIGNACGLHGLLHCTTNMQVANAIDPDSKLDVLLKAAMPLKPTERAQLLYDSEMLEAAHTEAAHRGDSVPPDVENWVDTHAFIAFVKGPDGHLWELESRRKGPVDRGVLGEDDDLLSDKALSLGPRAYVRREVDAGTTEGRFSCIALS